MNELQQYKERLSIALRAAKICIFEVELQAQRYTFFENAQAIFGVSGEEILSQVQPFCQLEPEAYRRAVSEYFSHPDDEDVIQAAFARILSGRPAIYEARMKAGASEFVWCRLHVTPVVEQGVPVRMVGVITDISDIREETESLKKAANLDDFTGLYQKGHTLALIRDVLQREPGTPFALVMLDIDDFKRFNDTYGHIQGDKMIKAVADRLTHTFRKTDILGRFGGDEFLICVRHAADSRQLRGTLKGLLRLQGSGFTCTNSMGAAFYPQDGADLDTLLRLADAALYRAKARKETVCFSSEP